MNDRRDGRVREPRLDEWIADVLARDGDREAAFTYCFPSTTLLLEYTRTIGARPEREVFALIERLLLPSCALGIDARRRAPSRPDAADDGRRQYWRRLSQWRSSGHRSAPPWEGLTWVIDLLPFSPAAALQIIDAYLMVHLHDLPDGRAQGLDDAREIIRARFIEAPQVRERALAELRGLHPRQLECVVAYLYDQMDYEVELTAQSRDGGRDVIAIRSRLGVSERLLVEIKRTARVGVDVARALLGVVAAEHANKGVLVTTGSISGPAREFLEANGMEGVAGPELVELLNAYCGHGWQARIPEMIGARDEPRRVRPR